VPRAWAVIALAQAHRPLPREMPPAWRERWAAEADAFGQSPLPALMTDPEGTVAEDQPAVVARHLELAQVSLEQSISLRRAARHGQTS
jgi:hypothetical protein